MLLPFVAGMVLAYFLNPVVNKISQKKIPRWLGSFGVLLGFGLILAAILALILPLAPRSGDSFSQRATGLCRSIP